MPEPWTMFSPGGTLADEIVQYMNEDCHVVGSTLYAPFYVASIGAHIANLRNKIEPEHAPEFFANGAHPFYMASRVPQDLRLHLLYVTPPGRGKSLYLDFNMMKVIGFLNDTPIPILRQSQLTAAGLIGTFHQGKKGEVITTPGDAMTYRSGIFGFDEVSALLRSRSDYDADKNDILLQLLDRGLVRKRLGLGVLEFQTYVTMWGGTQPSPTEDRINLNYGMARRFVVMKFSPTPAESALIAQSYEETLGQEPNLDAIVSIRQQITNTFEECFIEDIAFADNVKALKAKLGLGSIDANWVDRLMIGWNMMTNYEGETSMLVTSGEHIERMVKAALNWKYSNLIHGHLKDVLATLDQDQPYTTTELKWTLVRGLGLTYKDVNDVLEYLKEKGLIEAQPTKSKSHKVLWKVTVTDELVRDVLDFDVAKLMT